MKCFCKDSAKMTIDFLDENLKRAAEATVADIVLIIQSTKHYVNELPHEVVECLDYNDEYWTLLDAYGIDEETDTFALEKSIIRYITLHFVKVKASMICINRSWESHMFQEVGRNTAELMHDVIAMSKSDMMMEDISPRLDNRAILYEVLKGMFRENELKEPKKDIIYDCFPESIATEVVDYIDRFFDTVEFTSLREVIEFLRVIVEGRNIVPVETRECMAMKDDWLTLKLRYGLNEHTNIPKYYARVLKYTTTHLRSVRRSFTDIKVPWDEDEFITTGEKLACLLHKIADEKKEDD